VGKGAIIVTQQSREKKTNRTSQNKNIITEIKKSIEMLNSVRHN
jgi:hypothetical protein